MKGLKSAVGRNRTFVLFCVLLLVLALIYWGRLSLSVELTDESEYHALAYRVIAGNTPYADSWEAQGGGSLLATPVLALYQLINGGFDGSLLFMRRAYFVFALAVLIGIIFCLRDFPKKIAVFAVVPAFFFVPHAIPYISYNSFSVWLIALGCFLAYAAAPQKKLWLFSAACGVACALATLAYPSLIILCLLNVPLLCYYYWKEHGRRGMYKLVGAYIGGGVLVAFIAVFVLLVWVGYDGLKLGIEGLLNGPYNMKKLPLGQIFGKLGGSIRSYLKGPASIITLIGGILMLLLGLAFRRHPHKIYIISGLCIALHIIFICLSLSDAVKQRECSALLLMEGVMIVCLSKGKLFRAGIFLFLAPSVILVLIRSFTSDTYNIIRQTYAAYPMFICIGLFLYSWRSSQQQPVDIPLALTSLTMAVLCLSVSYINVYRDAPVGELTAQMESGIYRGLYTTEERKQQIETLEKEIEAHAIPGKTLMIANRFAGGYLMAGMKPFTPSTYDPMLINYGFTGADFVYFYFDTHGGQPDIIFVINTPTDHYDLDNPEIEFNSYLFEHYEISYQSEKGNAYFLTVFQAK